MSLDWRLGSGLGDWVWAEELALGWWVGSGLKDWVLAGGLALGWWIGWLRTGGLALG